MEGLPTACLGNRTQQLVILFGRPCALARAVILHCRAKLGCGGALGQPRVFTQAPWPRSARTSRCLRVRSVEPTAALSEQRREPRYAMRERDAGGGQRPRAQHTRDLR